RWDAHQQSVDVIRIDTNVATTDPVGGKVSAGDSPAERADAQPRSPGGGGQGLEFTANFRGHDYFCLPKPAAAPSRSQVARSDRCSPASPPSKSAPRASSMLGPSSRDPRASRLSGSNRGPPTVKVGATARISSLCDVEVAGQDGVVDLAGPGRGQMAGDSPPQCLD